MMHWGKKALAALLSVAMTVTLLPVGGMSVKAAETKAPVLHYDMSHVDGKLTDVSGNGYDGTLQGITDSDFITEGESTILNFDGSEKYVEIPSGSITGEKFSIEATYSDSTKSNAWLFTLGSVRGKWPNVKNYLFVSPVSPDENYDGKMLAAIKDESTEHRVPTSKLLTSDTTKDNVVTVVFNYGNVTYYLNGEASDVTETDISIVDLLGAGSTEECMGYLGRSLYTDDPSYKGTIRDFKIYNYAMTAEEVVSNYEAASVEIMKNSVLKSAQETMLNGNNPSEVTSDLAFPAEIEGVSLNWTSSDTTVIDATGKYVYEGEESKEVTISVTGTKDNAEFLKKEWKLTVTNKLVVDMNALTIPNMDNIKGNITLPTTGKTGSSITWTSDKPEVISVTEKENQGYDNIPAGVVTRQEADTVVKLTATITADQKSKTKDFNVTVKAKTKTDELTDYVFAYFIGDGAGQEKIFLATSQDGLNWEEINDAEPFLESDLGEKGLRDPYIFRSAEGDKFYLIATDLQIAAGNGWTVAQQGGSQAIMVWESDDLVHWSEQRMVTVSAGIEAGCTWAPEVFYDDKTGEYIVFWASKTKPNDYDRQRLYYCKTRDFYTFTEPKLWIEKTFSVIDTTVVRDDDDTYYRFTKNEDGDAKYIFLEKSQSMLGEWESVSSTSLESEKWVEGPCCFRFNDDDIEKAGGKWGVLLDDFGGVGYYPMITSDLATAEFTKLTTANLPKLKKPRHGTVMRITSAEYDALMEAYGVKINDKNIPAVITTDSGYTLPEKIKVSVGRQEKDVAVTWDVTKDAFTKAGTVKATATIPELNNQTVSVTIEVISANLIYYIDSGVGDWNENLKESGSYNKVAELLTLRNNKPDQLYTAGSWGFVNDSSNSIAGNRTSATDSIYTNGWWAKSDKSCEYILPLESGTYSATGYFAEWWSTTRPMKFCVKYTDDNNQEVTQEAAITISGSASQQTVSLNFKVENVAETTEVHFSSVKTGTADPVIAGLSVEKIADGKVEAEITKGWGQITVPGTKTIQEGNTEEIAVNYPKGFLDNISKVGLTISKTLTSSDTEVVDITKDGKITAKLAGTADITTKITLSDQRTKEFITKVTVTAKPSEKDIAIAAVNKDWDKIAVSPASKTLQVGNTQLITVNYPEGLLDNISKAGLTISRSYTSSNVKVAEVAQNGKITAKTAGTANITTKITLSNKKTKSFITKITVTAKPSTEIPVKTLKLNKTKLTLELKKSYTLKATVTPSNATNKKVSWKSTDSKIVSVSNGKLTAKKVGSADIFVTAGGKMATCKVTVKIGVKKVTLNKKSVTLGVKETFALKTTITPKNATNKTVKWTSDKKNIATVNTKGVVTAKKAGKAKITATVDGKKVTCTVTVKKAPSKITLNKKSVSLKKNKTFQIKVKLPKNTASNKITYKSNKPKIVSVTSSGKVKALKKGSATITVQTFNKKKATLKVTVK